MMCEMFNGSQYVGFILCQEEINGLSPKKAQNLIGNFLNGEEADVKEPPIPILGGQFNGGAI